MTCKVLICFFWYCILASLMRCQVCQPNFAGSDARVSSRLNEHVDEKYIRNVVEISPNHRPMFNASSVSGPQRLKRASPREVTKNIANGLRVLGLTVQFAQPIAGKAISITSAIATSLLQLIFPTDEPIHAMKEIVWNERALQQKMKMIGVRQLLRNIEWYNGSNVGLNDERMMNLLDILSYDKCLFMHRDDIRSSAVYFKEFATTHLVVIYAVANIHSSDVTPWQETLETNLVDYVTYGKYVIQELNRVGRDGNALLEDTILRWTSLLPVWKQQQMRLDLRGAISSGQNVSFRLAENKYFDSSWRDSWLSFWWRWWPYNWTSYSTCTFSNCPGPDNPMERGSQFWYFWKCWGEVFYIESIDRERGILETCSKVAVHYSQGGGAGWLNTDCDVSECTGGTASMRLGECVDNVLRINVTGKPCGVPVMDRDTIELSNHYTGIRLRIRTPPLCFYNLNGCVSDGTHKYPKFAIFRSDVSQNYFYSLLPCNE